MGWFSLRNIASVAAAPFTGGASLLAMNNKDGDSIIGDLTGANAAKKANQKNIEMQNYWNERTIGLSNTEVQRRMEDLRKAGINPVLAGVQGASTPTLGSAQVQNEMPGGYMAQATQAAGIINTLAQAKNLGVNSSLQRAQVAETNAKTAQTLLDTSISKDMKPATVKQAYQNVENAVAQQKLVEAQTAQTGSQKALTDMETKLTKKQKEKMVTTKGISLGKLGTIGITN